MEKPRTPRNKQVLSNKVKPSFYKMNPETNTLVKKRHPYFRYYRVERNAISLLENTFSKSLCKQEYRANRFIYYVIIPKLLRKLMGYRPDLLRLLQLEEQFYELMLSYKFYRFEQHRSVYGPMPLHGRKPKRLPLVFKCYTTVEDG